MKTHIPRTVLSRWADNLYAMGKTATDSRIASGLVDVAKMIYSQRDAQLGDYVEIEHQVLKLWKQKIRNLSQDKSVSKQISKQISSICKSLGEYLERQLPVVSDLQKESRLFSRLLWRSVLLCFTLWYGGQSFSLRNRELETELAIDHNHEMKQALKGLLADSVFSEKATGLLVMNPRLKRNVDAATLFLISFGENLGSQIPAKRGYYTIQSGFINYSRVRHHPMVYLVENVRSYVSDYCQRIFGKLFSLLSEKGYKQDYSIMRRFVIRLSLFSSLRFAVSGEEKIEAIIDRLESLGAITLVSDQAGEMYILLKGDLMT